MPIRPARAPRPKRIALAAAIAIVASLASSALAVTVQQNKLRIAVSAKLAPHRLPRHGTAAVDLAFSGRIATVDGTPLPQLRQLDVRLNRHGLIDAQGFPYCREQDLISSTTQEALARCRGSQIGSGNFRASVVLPEQIVPDVSGHLLVFNGIRGGKHVVFAQIYVPDPFPTAFLVTFSIRHLRHGSFGTVLSASLPPALGSTVFVNRMVMRIGRDKRQGGDRRGFINAGCPAPAGLQSAVFPLARADFHFAGGKDLRVRVGGFCEVRE
jgi:hypothetical protein